MTDAVPSAATFDIFAVLQGRSYPEIAVPFYVDEAAALQIGKGEKRLTELAALGRVEDHDTLEKSIEAAKAALRASRYVYHLRGIPNKVRDDALKKAFEKYPSKRDVIGNEEDNSDRNSYYATLLWQAMTVKIEAPDGSVQQNLDLETIQNFRDYAPGPALEVITEGIRELGVGVKAGFESAAQDPDFLS